MDLRRRELDCLALPYLRQGHPRRRPLVVREGQVAIFVQEGVLSDVFGPGTYELSTNSPAISGFFDSIAYQFNNPYKGDVYFFSTKKFAENGWGTKNPIMYEADGFGALELRAFGHFDFKLTDPTVFLREVVSTEAEVSIDQLVGKLRSKMASAFGDMLNESKLPFAKVSGQFDELGEAMMSAKSGLRGGLWSDADRLRGGERVSPGGSPQASARRRA